MEPASFDLWKFIQENTLSFLFVTVFLGSAVEFIRRFYIFITTQKYRGWVLKVDPKDTEREEYTHNILWEEVKRFESSAFEKRKFIQSVVSSEGGWLYAGQVETFNPDGWVFEDKTTKAFRFNLAKLPEKKN